MPTPYLQKLSKEYDIPMSDLEKYWDDAKNLAKEQDKEDDFAYITGIFKKIINFKYNIKENINGIIYKKDNKWIFEESINESFLKKLFVGAGLIMIYKWLSDNTKEIEGAKLSYGDKVSNGKNEGVLIKKNNTPHILVKNKGNVIKYEKWTKEWKKV